jgi:exodeoxyribonuclease V gamma subunit
MQLIQFYRHPARYLLQQRLNLRFEMDEELLNPREPFVLEGLEAWQLRQLMLSQRMKGNVLADSLPLIQATGVLPQGLVGEQAFYEQAQKVNDFADIVFTEQPKAIQEARSFELDLGEFTLMGQLEGISEQGLFEYDLAKTKGADLLAVWCRHLVLNCLKPQGVICESRWITEDSDVHLKPVDDAEAILTALLGHYWQGLQQPLALFSKTSFAYAKAELNGGKANPDTAIKTAWLGNQHLNGEMNDLYYQQLYHTPPLDDEFKQLALAIYQPIYDHLAESKL